MADALLVIDAGSTSLKFSLFAAQSLDLRLHGEIEGIGGNARFHARDSRGTQLGEKRWEQPLDRPAALGFLLDFLPGAAAYDHMAAVGHRVVHGGRRFGGPVRVDAAILAELDELVPLAPLHQPYNLAAIRALAALDRALPQVACFDTSFHRSEPPVAQVFALPPSITLLGVQRYGSHGLSYEYVASVLPELDARAATGRTIVAHLDTDSSLCALSAGRSVAAIPGFSVPEVTHAYVQRIGREIDSLAATLGGLDGLVFTASIGKYHPAVRAGVCAAAASLGLEFDRSANESGGPRISRESSRVSALVIATDEQKMIARHTREVLRT